MNTLLRLAAAVTLPLLLAQCGSSKAPDGSTPGGTSGQYDVTVTRTKLGVPHIKAGDLGSMGYGYGYSFAEDNLCVLQEDLVTIRGERSKYFGRDGSYLIVPNGVNANNVDSDFFWKLSANADAVARQKNGTVPEFQRITQGFVEGYNRYIR